MTGHIDLLGISGSLRRGSYNTGLLRAASEMLPEGMTLEIYDLADIPMYNADVEAAGDPEAVRRFKSRVAAADALLIATPEYNHSVPGVLKNAVDWASRKGRTAPINGKLVAMLGAGGRSGTAHAQAHLRQILNHVQARLLAEPEVTVARAWEKFDAEGRLVDEPTRRQIRNLLAALNAQLRQPQAELAPLLVSLN